MSDKNFTFEEVSEKRRSEAWAHILFNNEKQESKCKNYEKSQIQSSIYTCLFLFDKISEKSHLLNFTF